MECPRVLLPWSCRHMDHDLRITISAGFPLHESYRKGWAWSTLWSPLDVKFTRGHGTYLDLENLLFGSRLLSIFPLQKEKVSLIWKSGISREGGRKWGFINSVGNRTTFRLPLLACYISALFPPVVLSVYSCNLWWNQTMPSKGQPCRPLMETQACLDAAWVAQ